MKAFLSSILVFVVVLFLTVLSRLSGGLPAVVLSWLRGVPWAEYGFWHRLVDSLFFFPLCALVLFCALWLLLSIWPGTPEKYICEYLETDADKRFKGGASRQSVCYRLIQLFAYDWTSQRRLSIFRLLQLCVYLGAMLMLVASLLGPPFDALRDLLGINVYANRAHLTLALSMFLVGFFMRAGRPARIERILSPLKTPVRKGRTNNQ